MKRTTMGERILLNRREKGMTQERLGELVGVTKNTIYRLERGQLTKINSDVLRALAKSLNVSSDYLLGIDAETELSRMQKEQIHNA